MSRLPFALSFWNVLGVFLFIPTYCGGTWAWCLLILNEGFVKLRGLRIRQAIGSRKLNLYKNNKLYYLKTGFRRPPRGGGKPAGATSLYFVEVYRIPENPLTIWTYSKLGWWIYVHFWFPLSLLMCVFGSLPSFWCEFGNQATLLLEGTKWVPIGFLQSLAIFRCWNPLRYSRYSLRAADHGPHRRWRQRPSTGAETVLAACWQHQFLTLSPWVGRVRLPWSTRCLTGFWRHKWTGWGSWRQRRAPGVHLPVLTSILPPKPDLLTHSLG